MYIQNNKIILYVLHWFQLWAICLRIVRRNMHAPKVHSTEYQCADWKLAPLGAVCESDIHCIVVLVYALE